MLKETMNYKKNIYLFLAFDFLSTIAPLSMLYALFLQAGSYSLVFIGTLLSVYQIAKIVCEVPSGYLSDKFGRKRVGIAGQALFILFLVLTLQRQSPVLLVAAAAIRGIAYAALSGTFDSMFAESVLEVAPDRFEHWLGVDKVVFYAAYGLAGILGGLLASWSLSGTMLIMIALQSLCLLLCVCMKETTSQKEREQLHLQDLVPALHANPRVVFFLLLPAVIAICLLPFEDFYTLLLQSENVPYPLIGFFVGSYSLLGALTGLFAQKVSDKLGRTCMEDVLPVVIFVLFGGMSLMLSWIYASWAVYCLIGICASLNNIAYNAALNRSISNQFRSTILSIRSLLIGLCGMVLSPLAGWMITRLGYSLTFLLLAFAGLGIYGLLYFWTSKRTGKSL